MVLETELREYFFLTVKKTPLIYPGKAKRNYPQSLVVGLLVIEYYTKAADQ